MNYYLKVTLNMNKDFSGLVRDTLESLGVLRFTLQSGRMVVLSDRRWPLGLGGDGVYESPLDSFEFFIPLKNSEPLLNTLVALLHLDSPGRGSLFTEKIKLHASDPPALVNEPSEKLPQKLGGLESAHPLFSDLLLISCIVQRGRGNDVAKAALHSVAGVPWINYGTGAGLRERLGLIRITIPAEKETVNLVVSQEEGVQVISSLIREARLNYPGQGFIYACPIQKGVINTRLSMDRSRHLATMEQIIQTLDLLKGSPTWRRKVSSAEVQPQLFQEEKEPEVDMTFYCIQGNASRLVEAARRAGASGATICKIRQGQKIIPGPKEVMPALEVAHLVIRRSLEEKVLQALETAGLFQGDFPGYCEVKPVSHSFTYRPEG